MSHMNPSFVRLGGRPSSKISQARSRISIISNDPPPAPNLLQIATTLTSAIRYDSLSCEICLERKPVSEFTSLGKCEHIYCRQCLAAYLTTKIFVNEVDIKCLNEECREELDERLEVFMSLPENIKQQYFKMKENKDIMRNPLLSHCPTTDCRQILSRPNRDASFYCPTCHKMFCPVCLLEEHIGQCDSYAQMYLKNNYMYKKCPNCRMIVQKSEGCDHMTCTCGYEFCYNCGGRYSTQHNCWFYEQINVDQPVSTGWRILNHILLPFALVLIVLGILTLLILTEVIILTIAPLFATYQLVSQTCCCNWFINLLLLIPVYPLITLVIFFYAQSLVVGWFFGWCDFGARIISYLKR